MNKFSTKLKQILEEKIDKYMKKNIGYIINELFNQDIGNLSSKDFDTHISRFLKFVELGEISPHDYHILFYKSLYFLKNGLLDESLDSLKKIFLLGLEKSFKNIKGSNYKPYIGLEESRIEANEKYYNKSYIQAFNDVSDEYLKLSEEYNKKQGKKVGCELLELLSQNVEEFYNEIIKMGNLLHRPVFKYISADDFFKKLIELDSNDIKYVIDAFLFRFDAGLMSQDEIDNLLLLREKLISYVEEKRGKINKIPLRLHMLKELADKIKEIDEKNEKIKDNNKSQT